MEEWVRIATEWVLAFLIPIVGLLLYAFRYHEIEKRIGVPLLFGGVIPFFLIFFLGNLLGIGAGLVFFFIYAPIALIGSLGACAESFKSPRTLTVRDETAAREKVRKVQDLYDKAIFPTALEFTDAFFKAFESKCLKERTALPDPEALGHIRKIVLHTYRNEVRPKPAAFDAAKFRRERAQLETRAEAPLSSTGKYSYDVTAFESRLENPSRTIEVFQSLLLECFISYARALPPKQGSPFSIPFSTTSNFVAAIEAIERKFVFQTLPSGARGFTSYLRFGDLDFIYDPDTTGMAEAFPDKHPTALSVTDDLSPTDRARLLFAGTPFMPLFDREVELPFPQEVRFRHEWVIGLTGSGKTSLLQAQIAHDLEAVKRGEATIIVIDSKGMPPDKMLSKIAHLKDFAPGQRLDGKLVLLQPDMSPPGSSETMPPSLAIFDVGQHNTNLAGREREILEASALDMITSALTDASGPQKDLVEFLVQFCLAIPGATLETLGEILETPPKLFEQKFAATLAILDPTVSRYLRSAMGPSGHELTRHALLRRVTAMVRHKTFRRMYQGTRNRFNMEEALDEGKVILINTDIALLKEDACQTFGRYFISLLLQATFQRKSKKPVYCYIDECQDYLKNEERITLLIDKARDQKVALILAHHRMSQLNTNVVAALASSAIRFVSPNDAEASQLARYVRDTDGILPSLQEYHFATFIDRVTPHALSVTAKPYVIEHMPTMSDDEYAVICQRMRDLYCAPVGNAGSAPPTPPSTPPTDWEDVV